MSQRFTLYGRLKPMLLGVMVLLMTSVQAEQPSLGGVAASSSGVDNTIECRVLDLELQHYYEGQCLDGLAHGQGIARGQHNAFYQGQFEQGAKSGYGVKLYANGDAYAGYWRNDFRHGHGVYEFGEHSPWRGDRYVGPWQRDLRHGRGTYYFYPTNESFVAEWVEGQTDAYASPLLIRRKRSFEALQPVLGQVGREVCSTLTDGASPHRVAHGKVVAVEGERIQVKVLTQAVLDNSQQLEVNPRWDLMTEWMVCSQ